MVCFPPIISSKKPIINAPSPAVTFSTMAKSIISTILKSNVPAAYIPPKANTVIRPSL
jgi:hypothetical protein